MKPISKFLGLVVVWMLMGNQVFAAASDWDKNEYAAVRLISAADSLGDGESVPLGLHFKLQPGWKIYWRSAGDAGYPPRLTWKGSDNLETATMKWPRPERFSILGLETVGYKKEVVIPIDLKVKDAAQSTRLNLGIDYLICDEICIPVQAKLGMTLQAGRGAPSSEMQLLSRYASQVPAVQRGDGWVQGLSVKAMGLESDAKQTHLWVHAYSDRTITHPDLLVEGPEDHIFKSAQASLTLDGKEVLFRIPVDGQYSEKPLAGQNITLTFMDQSRAVEAAFKVGVEAQPDLAVKAYRASGAGPQQGGNFLLMLGFALLGGLILNLMPCVLPVLSIKLLGVIKHGGGDISQVRLSFLASAAGIVTSFMVLAVTLIVLKDLGVTVGWGIQFQQSWFLIAMILMISLFAFNLWGLFEISLPGWAGRMGEKSGHVEGLGGHFLSGALATLLATPCSAPFLGTAIGFAFSRGGLEISAIFLALGLGLALPYFLVALKPTLATRLPKPGPWMVTLRKVLALALAATAIWLLSVLEVLTGLTAVLVIGGLMVTAGVALKIASRPMAWGGVVVLAVLAFLAPSQLDQTRAEAVQTIGDEIWTPFDQAQISEITQAGNLVFVDVTADWCITCQVNKKLVFGNGAVAEQLKRDDVIAMKADWTKPSDVIAKYLASFNRYGIPFNAVYGPKAPQGIPLPEVMTPDMVLEAMKKARD